MGSVLVDSNVILDIFTQDPQWFDWSSQTLARVADYSDLVINPLIYAEVSNRFTRIEELNEALSDFQRSPLPWDAAFVAAKAFLQYRRRGGKRAGNLPDFYIGAHAAVLQLPLLTRDAHRYRTYFPTVEVIAP